MYLPLFERQNRKFTNLSACFSNMKNLILSIFFPYVLFGQIYKKSDFGSFKEGCWMYFIIQFFLIVFFIVISYDILWGNLYGIKYQINQDIYNCKIINDCNTSYINNKLVNDLSAKNLIKLDCQIPHYVCNCLKDSVEKNCLYYYNYDSNYKISLDYIKLTLGIFVFIDSIVIGSYLSYYRQKIAEKFKIKEKCYIGFFLHSMPILNLLALCQEANTVDYLYKYVEPINVF